MKSNREYRTISKDILFSRLNLSSTCIKLPRPIVIDTTITEQKPMMNCQEEYFVNNQNNNHKINNKHGNLKSIISRSQDDNGRVTYLVLWQDGTQTQENVTSIRELAFDQFETYEHKVLNLTLSNPTDYNGLEGDVLDFGSS